MSEQERERFLATERNGVLSVAEDDGGVVASPVWFLYEPGGDITLHLTDPSLKLAAVRAAGKAAITVQDEGDIARSGRPPRYVSATGPVVEDRHRVPRRVVRIRPRRWFTRNYGKGGERWDEIVLVEGASAGEF